MTDITPEKAIKLGEILAGEITATQITVGCVTPGKLKLHSDQIELHVKVTQVHDQHLNAAADVQRNATFAAVPCDGDGPNMVLGVPGVPMIHMQLSVREPELLPLFLQDKRFKLILVPEAEQ